MESDSQTDRELLAGVEKHLCTDHSPVIVRRDLQPLDMADRYLFHPHALPDPALRRVPHPAALKRLLALSVEGSIRIIPHGHMEKILSIIEQRRDIQTEGKIASGMLPGRLTVDIYFADLVNSAKMKKITDIFFPVQRDLPLIVEILPRLQDTVYT